jgi:hypothetical protein
MPIAGRQSLSTNQQHHNDNDEKNASTTADIEKTGQYGRKQ